MKRKIYSYFRYHHFFTFPGKKSHSDFIDALGWLEELSGVKVEANTINESWPLILKAMNSLDENGLRRLREQIIYNRRRSLLN